MVLGICIGCGYVVGALVTAIWWASGADDQDDTDRQLTALSSGLVALIWPLFFLGLAARSIGARISSNPPGQTNQANSPRTHNSP